MNFRTAVPFIGAALFLAACSGGGSGGSSVAPSSATTLQQVSGTLTIGVPPTSTSSTARKPAYVSSGTNAVAVYIDSQTTPAGTLTSCSAATGGSSTGCSIPWSAYVAVPATHTFHVVAGDSTSHNILSVGSGSYYLFNGNNNTLSPTLSLNGVVAEAEFFWNTCPSPTNPGSCTGYVDLLDADGDYIENTGGSPSQSISPTNGTVYDNVPSALTFTNSVNSGIGYVSGTTTGSYATWASSPNSGTLSVLGPAINEPASTGIPINVACVSGQGSATYPGTSFSVTISGDSITTYTGSGALLTGQNDGLTNYPTTVTIENGYGATFYCTSGAISSSIGTLPVN